MARSTISRVHPLSLVLTLFGGVERVMCDMAKPYPTRRTPQGEREVEVYDIATILMRLDNGASGFIAVSRTAWGRKGRIAIQIFGGKGAILFDQERLNEFQLYLTSDRPTEQGFRTVLDRAASQALRPLHSGAGPWARLQRPQDHRMPAADRPHPRRGHDRRHRLRGGHPDRTHCRCDGALVQAKAAGYEARLARHSEVTVALRVAIDRLSGAMLNRRVLKSGSEASP